MTRFRQSFFAFVVSVLLLYALLRQFGLEATLGFVREARPGLLLLGLAFLVTGYLVRGARWRILGAEPELFRLPPIDPDRVHGQQPSSS